MFDAIVELFPAEWRATVTVLLSPLRWIPELQATLLRPSMIGDSVAGIVLVSATLLLPALLVIVGLWCTMLSLYTLPFRSGRGGFITSLLMAWWDAGRCIWLYWTGMARLVVALFGWMLGAIRDVCAGAPAAPSSGRSPPTPRPAPTCPSAGAARRPRPSPRRVRAGPRTPCCGPCPPSS